MTDRAKSINTGLPSGWLTQSGLRQTMGFPEKSSDPAQTGHWHRSNGNGGSVPPGCQATTLPPPAVVARDSADRAGAVPSVAAATGPSVVLIGKGPGLVQWKRIPFADQVLSQNLLPNEVISSRRLPPQTRAAWRPAIRPEIPRVPRQHGRVKRRPLYMRNYARPTCTPRAVAGRWLLHNYTRA
jgi:hypothetical protein